MNLPAVDLRLGDCLDVLRELPDASIDAIITDPPYGLAEHKPERIAAALVAWTSGDREHVPAGSGGFMGRSWDTFVPPPAVWDECLRVLKPGGHLAAFAGSRTYDLMGMSIRLAGFEIRDGLQWLYGSGMPKGQNVGKAIDRMAGAEREVVGQRDRYLDGGTRRNLGDRNEVYGQGLTANGVADVTAPATPEAARWEGWNTSLKPAVEPVVLARRPLAEKNVAANVLAHGTGALNVEACRVESGPPPKVTGRGITGAQSSYMASVNPTNDTREWEQPSGRWPTNVLLTHAPECHEPGECAPGCCPVAELDAQSGNVKGGHSQRYLTDGRTDGGNAALGRGIGHLPGTSSVGYNDEGGASRFFPSFRYQSKAPSKERPKIDGRGWPTVKPRSLMAWLARLLTPPGGVILDPFAGTAATLQAARDEGFASIGIERDEFAYRLARQRLDDPSPPAPAEAAPAEEPADVVPLPGQVDLFDLLDGEAS